MNYYLFKTITQQEFPNFYIERSDATVIKKVSSSRAKIYESFSNYFLKTKTNNSCFVVLNVHVKGYREA